MPGSDPLDPLDPLDAFAQLGRIRLGETDVDAVMRQIADLAKHTIPGAMEVSVTLVPPRGPHSAAFTGDVALALDESQYERGHGPCLYAAESGETMQLPDMSQETRWPDFARRALEADCQSSMSIGLPVQDRVTGALNVYAGKPDVFDDHAVTVAETFAGYAAVALANVHVYDTTATLAHNLQKAMESRAIIEQAKGIIMADRRCSAEEAFRLLSTASQTTNRKLRDIAAALVARTTPGDPSGDVK